MMHYCEMHIMLFQYFFDCSFRTVATDRIGWTYEGNIGTISFSYVDHKTLFRKVENQNFPTVGAAYTFDNVHLPSIFSVGVVIDTCKYACVENSNVHSKCYYAICKKVYLVYLESRCSGKCSHVV